MKRTLTTVQEMCARTMLHVLITLMAFPVYVHKGFKVRSKKLLLDKTWVDQLVIFQGERVLGGHSLKNVMWRCAALKTPFSRPSGQGRTGFSYRPWQKYKSGPFALFFPLSSL